MLDTNDAKCGREVVNDRKMTNAKRLCFECTRVLHEDMLLLVITYGSNYVRNMKYSSNVQSIQIDNLGCWGCLV